MESKTNCFQAIMEPDFNHKLAGVVVLFNPDRDVEANILSYLGEIDILYVIDNSISENRSLIDSLNCPAKIRYIPRSSNTGLAKALNVGAESAIKDGFRWLLTMDQDSRFRSDSIKLLLDYIEQNDVQKTAIVAPFHTNVQSETPPLLEEELKLTVITSGSLMNLQVYQEIGPFLNKLFIDSIDHEYCLRAVKSGYQVVRVNKAVLDHNLGDQKVHFRGMVSTHHNPTRRYYITRNRLYIVKSFAKDFPGYCFFLFKENLKDFIKIILFEEQKFKKITAMGRGLIDSWRMK